MLIRTFTSARRMHRRLIAARGRTLPTSVMGLIIVTLTACGLTSGALAQPPSGTRQIEVSGSGAGPILRSLGGALGGVPQDPVLRPELIDRVAGILGLTSEQVVSAKALQQGHLDALRPLRDDLRQAGEEAREQFRETRDLSVFEPLGEKAESLRRAMNAAAEAFKDDFRVMLTPAQLERWPRFERALRRERAAAGGVVFVSVPGERVDLFRLLERIELSEEQRAELDPALERYELELDAALTERLRISERLPSPQPPGPGAPAPVLARLEDPEALTRWLDEMRSASIRIRDLNRRFAREAESVMTPEQAAAFRDRFLRESYPSVYAARRRGEEAIRRALALDDLTPEQAHRLEELRETYLRQSEALDERARRALDEAAMPLAGGVRGGEGHAEVRTTMMITADGTTTTLESGQSAELARERRELESKTLDSVLALLTEPQRECLPPDLGRRRPQVGG